MGFSSYVTNHAIKADGVAVCTKAQYIARQILANCRQCYGVLQCEAQAGFRTH